MPSKPEPAITIRSALKVGPESVRRDDSIAVEEPLEIRVAGDTVCITMRTPGHDRELALGFLYAEGVIRSIDDVGSVSHCGTPGREGFGNVIEVLPGPGVALAPERTMGVKRGTLTTSSCGVCGRLSIEDLAARCKPIDDVSRMGAARLLHFSRSIRDEQRVFERTGGVHAAALLHPESDEALVREDIGRHNAVDKVVGALVFSRGLPAKSRALLVSGRASFEIVQKAVAAEIAIVASISAASSLAIDLALAMNVTLASFVRGDTMTVYAHPERITI